MGDERYKEKRFDNAEEAVYKDRHIQHVDSYKALDAKMMVGVPTEELLQADQSHRDDAIAAATATEAAAKDAIEEADNAKASVAPALQWANEVLGDALLQE